jgi:hypothetical protein
MYCSGDVRNVFDALFRSKKLFFSDGFHPLFVDVEKRQLSAVGPAQLYVRVLAASRGRWRRRRQRKLVNEAEDDRLQPLDLVLQLEPI